jgi:opacity protein-like surface antigen
MKLRGFVITAVVVGLSGPAFAQTQTGSSQQTAANAPANQAAVVNTSSDNPRSWMASGFIGTNFGASRNSSIDLLGLENLDTNNSTSVNFGGQVAYTARGVIGGEFLADFSPGLGTFDNVLFQKSPDVNSYMFNLIAMAPFGQVHSVDPYVSGGIGAVTLRSTIFAVNPTRVVNLDTLATETISGSRFGWDLGGGVMAWSEKNWGFRGDVRYYKTSTNDPGNNFDINDIGDGTDFTRLELAGISFWKVNTGIAFRW